MSVVLDPKILSRMERLDLVARFVVEGFLSGRHKSPYRGYSVEFSQHRAYAPGDDSRHIDWKAYGKTERYYLKEYQQETNLIAHILVDVSKSMEYRNEHLAKIDYAKIAAASLAFLILDQQDMAGVYSFGNYLKVTTEPTGRMAAFYDMCEKLLSIGTAGEGQVAPALHQAAEMIKRRGVVVVISDFLSDVNETLRGLEHLRFEGHDVLALHVLDKAEIEFPFSGTCVFEGLEGGGSVLTDAPRIRKRYRGALDEFLEHLRSGCVRSQVDYLRTDTSQPLERILAAYLISRGRRRR
jgi:uncharacterized protein (DUF58 family)